MLLKPRAALRISFEHYLWNPSVCVGMSHSRGVPNSNVSPRLVRRSGNIVRIPPRICCCEKEKNKSRASIWKIQAGERRETIFNSCHFGNERIVGLLWNDTFMPAKYCVSYPRRMEKQPTNEWGFWDFFSFLEQILWEMVLVWNCHSWCDWK